MNDLWLAFQLAKIILIFSSGLLLTHIAERIYAKIIKSKGDKCLK